MSSDSGRNWFQDDSGLERIEPFAQNLLENRNATIGLVILVPIILVTLVSPLLPLASPTEMHSGVKYSGPSTNHILGTDHLGRDLLSRVFLGGRTSLFLGIASVAFAMVLGIPIGLLTGYYGGYLDEFIMRFLDVIMSTPTLLMALLIIFTLGGNIWGAILAIGIVFAPRIARVVRSGTLSVKNQEFILAAEARGESDGYLLFMEILPNILSPIIVEGSIRIGYAILIGASLSFLGLGAQPPVPDWGFMVAEARNHIWRTPWYLLWPSIALGATVMGFNLLGDGLSDILDFESGGSFE